MLTRKELYRQLLHLAIGLSTVALLSTRKVNPLLIFFLIIVALTASYLSKYYSLPLLSFFLKHFERDEEKKRFPGKGFIFFFIGVLLSIKLFDTSLALAAIMILTLGDSISHVVGERFGRTRNIFNGHSKKLFEGTLAGLVAGFLGALLFVPPLLAFLGSLAGMIAEVVEIDLNQNRLDDNVVVPLAAGTAMLLAGTYL